MVETKPSRIARRPLLDRRWVGVMYAAFGLALLLLAAFQRAALLVQFPVALALLIVLVVATPLTAMVIGRGRTARFPTVLLLLIDALAALALIAATGGYTSPMWIGLLLVSTAAPLLLPGRWAAVLLVLVWLGYGALLLPAPPGMLAETVLAWSLRAVGVALVALVLHRALAAEEALRQRAERRERVLREFLDLSARLRVSSTPQAILEEVARTVQSSGDFDCVTLSTVDEAAGTATVAVAFGATGRRLGAVEGLSFPWRQVLDQLGEPRQVGPSTFRLETLPFRSIRNEQHLVLPLMRQDSGVQGMLTVSNPASLRDQLDEAAPLLELLANQAAAVLDNSSLYATLELRVVEATATAHQSREELAEARDRAETLYQVVRTLSRTLDEREVLSQALTLLQQATGAERGGILLIEPNTGRLAARSGFEGMRGAAMERLQEFGGRVIAQRQVLVIEDTRLDPRWPHEEGARTLLLAPLLLDNEPLGALVLGHAIPGAFTPEHAQLALAAGGQIAVALSKAQLYRYVSEQSEQLGHTLQLREEEISKSQAILSSIGEGVVVCDRLDRIRMINPAAEELLEIRAERYIGLSMTELPSGLQLHEAGGVQQVVIGQRTLKAHYAPVLATSGESLGAVVVYHDVTREVMADKLKTTFIATASHELRTPLTSIRGYVDLLLLGTIGPLAQPQRDFLKVVKHNVVQVVELIDDLLDVSKVEAGEVRLRRVPLDVGALVYEVSESLYSQFSEKSIHLALDIAPELPKVMADRQRLRQIVVNLISNACKYTPVGGNVDVVTHVDGDDLRVDVRDTGVGIASEAQPHIFTPFFRADNPLRDAAGGTGLGLSITKTLIELHGGQVWFESVEGKGTTFSVTLPLHGYEWTQPAWLEQGVQNAEVIR